MPRNILQMAAKKSKIGAGKHGFSSKKASAGYVGTGSNGNFAFPLPKISQKALAIPHSERMALLADFKVSERAAAERFGINRSTMHKWRFWLGKLASEKPTLVGALIKEPLKGRLIANQYYEKGPNWIRLNYGLTNVGTRGLLLWLKSAQFIDGARKSKR